MSNIDLAFESLGIDIESIDDTNKKILGEAEENDINIGQKNENRNDVRLQTFRITAEDRHIATELQLVPKAYENATFDVDKIKENIKGLYVNKSTRKITKKVKGFNDYVSICNGILTALRVGKLPTRSYIIGAPNSFGKTSFVNEAIITLNKQGFIAVPYISLVELAKIRSDSEEKLLKPSEKVRNRFLIKNEHGVFEQVKDDKDEYKLAGEFVTKAKTVTRQYDFYDYINADCLFVKFSAQESKEIESKTLYQVLSIRADRGLPTIVTVPYSIDIYHKDINLKRYIWDEIEIAYEKENCYDRLYHVSCFVVPYLGGLAEKGEKIDMSTGIIEE